MNRKRSFLLNSAAVVLFIMAVFNFLGAACLTSAQNWPDPVFQLNTTWSLSNRWVLVISGGLELFVSAFLLIGNSSRMKLGWLAWLATNLIVYRIGLWSVGASNFGDCLGNYIEWFLISPRTIGIIANLLIGFMASGSYAFLVLDWLRGRKPRLVRKFNKTSPSVIGMQPNC